MVFYDPLPTEIWFVIYKYEHGINLSKVNRQIRRIRYDVDIENRNLVNDFMEGYPIIQCSIVEWINSINSINKLVKNSLTRKYTWI